jgi:hypothetical protein
MLAEAAVGDSKLDVSGERGTGWLAVGCATVAFFGVVDAGRFVDEPKTDVAGVRTKVKIMKRERSARAVESNFIIPPQPQATSPQSPLAKSAV